MIVDVGLYTASVQGVIKTQDDAVVVLMAGLAGRLYVCCTCTFSARRVKSIHLLGSCQTHRAHSTHALHMQPKFITITDVDRALQLLVSSSHCCCQDIYKPFRPDQRPTEQHTYTSMSAISVQYMLHAFTVLYSAL